MSTHINKSWSPSENFYPSIYVFNAKLILMQENEFLQVGPHWSWCLQPVESICAPLVIPLWLGCFWPTTPVSFVFLNLRPLTWNVIDQDSQQFLPLLTLRKCKQKNKFKILFKIWYLSERCVLNSTSKFKD